MHILVVSDSHGAQNFMRRCVEQLRPDMILHLGDYYSDGEALHERYPEIPFLQVPGNCDLHRMPLSARRILIPTIGGVVTYMTHGDLQNVKMNLDGLKLSGRKAGAGLVVFGHTHVPHCEQTEDGMWVLNPGSCGYFNASAGMVEIEDQQVRSCRILTGQDLCTMA